MKKTLVILFTFISLVSIAQENAAVSQQPPSTPPLDPSLLKNVKYRLLGPFRGGRSGAVTGSYKNKNTFYFGATGGGVWKSIDGGNNWKNVTM